MSRVRASVIALQHRNFRLIWFGLLVSFTGTMMRNAALLWHVSLLVPADRKALALGAVGLVRVIPIIVFSLFSGVVADAWNRRRLMLLTNVLSGIISAALAVFAFRGMTADTVSMVIRNLIRQLETPDRLRGRVTGVNMVFFMGGPQLGEMEAGAVANWFGATVSVVSGGVGCLLATAWVAVSTPELVAYRRERTM